MVGFREDATVLFSYLNIGFLTFSAILKTTLEMGHPVVDVPFLVVFKSYVACFSAFNNFILKWFVKI